MHNYSFHKNKAIFLHLSNHLIPFEVCMSFLSLLFPPDYLHVNRQSTSEIIICAMIIRLDLVIIITRALYINYS